MPRTAILGVIGSDAHVVGITILEQALSAAGFDVVNLGVQTSQEDFVEAADEHDAAAVLVSSLYGHAEQDCRGLHDRIRAAELDVVTYVGGNLAVGQDDLPATRELFRSMGFDRVFGPEDGAQEAIAALARDLGVSETPAERTRMET
jgi:methylaspartate mutase sigma subunit